MPNMFAKPFSVFIAEKLVCRYQKKELRLRQAESIFRIKVNKNEDREMDEASVIKTDQLFVQVWKKLDYDSKSGKNSEYRQVRSYGQKHFAKMMPSQKRFMKQQIRRRQELMLVSNEAKPIISNNIENRPGVKTGKFDQSKRRQTSEPEDDCLREKKSLQEHQQMQPVQNNIPNKPNHMHIQEPNANNQHRTDNFYNPQYKNSLNYTQPHYLPPFSAPYQHAPAYFIFYPYNTQT